MRSSCHCGGCKYCKRKGRVAHIKLMRLRKWLQIKLSGNNTRPVKKAR